MDTAVTRDTEKHGRRYQDEVKESAFQLWDMRCNQNAEKVSALLATEQYGSLDVSSRTIRRWASEDEWESEASRRFEQVFPGIHHRLFRGIVYAAVEGQEYWQDVNAGRVEKPDKVRMMAVMGAFDRAGFSPVGKGVPHVNAIRSLVTSLAELTEEELHQREQDLGAGRHG